jgi:E-phenylitaconyl-CoA hydratase
LINRIVPDGRLLDEAMACAQRLACGAPLATQAAKELALRSRDVDLATGLRIEQMFNRFLMSTSDAAEGARAFSEKRPPNFSGC